MTVNYWARQYHYRQLPGWFILEQKATITIGSYLAISPQVEAASRLDTIMRGIHFGERKAAAITRYRTVIYKAISVIGNNSKRINTI